jgi:ubiquinone/menaquinone biosynthesis C-methylase UbiE
MADNDALFAGSIPEIYDTYLVPLIFEAYAIDLAQRTIALEPRAILETAAGSGVVTRALASRMAAEAGYTVTDLNQPMLDHAQYKQGADGRLSWHQADALDLPFAEASFDAVACQFAVMFFPDKVAGYAEARRVLKPGGSFLFNVWDRIETNEIAEAVTDAAAAVFPDDPPRFLSRTPHGYYDLDVIRDELAQAGFANVAIATIDDISAAPSARHAAIAYCQGTPLRAEIEARGPDALALVTERATGLIAERFGTGPIAGKIRAHVITATG